MYKMLIVSVFGRVETNSNDRVNSIYDYIKFDNKIITSDFSHRNKIYRDKISKRDVDYLHVPAYKSNLSFRRIFSHLVFAIRLGAYLKKNGHNYDFIYCLLPTPSSAFICALYTYVYKKPIFITDTIDIWPEGLLSNRKISQLFDIALYPWRWLNIFAYKRSTAIFSATYGYLDHISKYNSNAIKGVFPLGIDLDKVKCSNKSYNMQSPSEIKIVYGGNLGDSYDFDQMINSVSYLSNNQSKYKVKLIIAGGGDKYNYIKELLDSSGLDFSITGNLDYESYLQVLASCDIGLNIFKKNKKVFQSYKFNDYVISSLYIINNLMGETASLIEKYQIGINVNDPITLCESLQKTLDNWDTISQSIFNNCNNAMKNELNKNIIYLAMQQKIECTLDMPKQNK